MKQEDKDELFVYLFVAVLSVANYPVHLTWGLKERLRAAGLCDAEGLTALTVDDIAHRLATAGYDRGAFMRDLLASRLQSVAERMIAVGLERVRDVLRHGNKDELSALFPPGNGVGPVVIWNFLSLRDH